MTRTRFALSLLLCCACSGLTADEPRSPLIGGPVDQPELPALGDLSTEPTAEQLLALQQQPSLPIGPSDGVPGGLNLGGGMMSFKPPEAAEGSLRPPALSIRTTNLVGVGTGQIPEDTAAKEMTAVRDLPEGPDRDGAWYIDTICWRAPNVFSHPLYFEDIMLERHGHQRFPWLQPWISGARFYATIPALPYLMTVEPMGDCNYLMGQYRPGTCAPVLKQRPPYQRDAVIVEGIVVSGLIVGVP